MRPSSVVVSVCTGLGLWLAAAPVEAQLVESSEPKRFEVTPVFGYQIGGAVETNSGGVLGAGELRLKDSFAWGAILSFLAHGGSAVELIYHRQDTDIEFDPAGSASNTDFGGFAVNYVQLGGRQEFGHGQIHPFISGSLGIGIFDPKEGDLDSSTRFSWSLGGGAKYTFASGRIGIRSDIKWWNTPVPSGEIGYWCGYYGCVATEGTDWVAQGQFTGGLVFLF